MRAVFTLASIALVLSSYAQGFVYPLGRYDLAPNWTATDINGNTHTLYDYLDQGYSVVLDLSTTWCPPCAELTASRALDSLQTLYGPGSPDPKVMVFFVESDPTTDMADLDGSSIGTPDGNTIMDWITGHTVVIIDDASIAQLYNVNGYPTVYTICPSRMIMGNYWPGGHMDYYLGLVNECGHHIADSPQDATLLGGQNFPDYCAGPSVELGTTLYNVGTQPITTATIEAYAEYVGQVVSTTTWTGSIGTYESVEVSLPLWDAPPDGQWIRYRLTTPDDDAANDSTDSEYMLVSSGISSSSQVTLEVLTDSTAQAVNWYIARHTDIGNVVLVEQVMTGELVEDSLYTYTWSMLDGGCYHLQMIMDEDVLLGPGYFRLMNNGVPFIEAQDCSFQQGWGSVYYSAYFSIDAQTGVDERPAPINAHVILPGDGTARLILPEGMLAERVSIFDGAGRAVYAQRMTSPGATIQVDHLSAGLYTFLIETAEGRLSVKAALPY